ncbi:Cof-type HAD-IIB family hydrolase [Aquibacillus salsiterrae]|uniref:Cof-type HAD-IIB family hydrolase n=1 Tax=Aquibacillus salsiterrae TaxID=2950439 RepID=A0A9X3WH53_9BACI|nr:Cof-type HAD-IIB family hydrolase [Aquibacillus salsiterrae]MDC3418518.1 Cof-type HAD-IIB family hydrolase [Aquibacillus salsiterrae]
MGQENRDIRLIALDMDGTLLNSNHEVSKQNRLAIEKAREKGLEVILSTGRHFSTCSAYAKSLNLSSYLITVNGSEIWTATGELVERQLLDVAIMELLVSLHKKHETYAWVASTNKIWRGEIPANLEDYEWLKFGFDTDSNETKEAIVDQLSKNELVELSNSSPTNIEVNAVGINKARAIEKVCARLGITMDQVMAMGDSLNDIKMIEEVGLGVAMGNAQDEVKAVCDWVTKHHDDDGVAYAINKLVL